jgi:integrase
VTKAPQKVQVFALGRPRPGVEKAKRRYYVKWRVDGRDRTRSFKTRVEADRYRSGLLSAVQDGQRFDPASGEPASWLEHSGAPTWWSWSQDWLALKWPQWSGHSRRSAVESLTLLTPLLVRGGAPRPPADLPDWLRTIGYRPRANPDGASAVWLERWSIALHEIQPPLIEAVLATVCSRADGGAVVPAVARRRRGTLGAVLRAAVRRELLATNPMDRVEWRAPIGSMAIDVATVPAPVDIRAIVDHVAALRSAGARYAALFAVIGIAGMRPSEAIGLRVQDVELPPRGWGIAALRGAVTSPGTRYTGDGIVTESKGLKHRATDATREVPLSPELVRVLRDHLSRFEEVDGRVFSNDGGRPPTATNYGPVWLRARAQLWPEGHPLASATVYDLRHAAATMMLRAAVPPAEVARRLGHSVDVLMRVYAGVFDDERDRSNQLIDRAMKRASV